MQEQASDLSFSPSFNNYSSDNLTAVAAKVCGESQQTHDGDEIDEFTFDSEFEFEFVSISTECDAESVSGDDFFAFNNRIRQIYPIFNRDLVLNEKSQSSSSSSEADELEGVSAESYCVWTPKTVESSPGRCKKSQSTGSVSKRWRLRDLVWRSNSTGEESLIFSTTSSSSSSSSSSLSPVNTTEKRGLREKKSTGAAVKIAGGSSGEKMTSAHEALYLRNRAAREGDKRRSYLPYRQDLVGLFGSVNGLGRTFPPY